METNATKQVIAPARSSRSAEARALFAVREAKRVRFDHQNECPHWDYDENNCATCDKADAMVESARAWLRRTRGLAPKVRA